MSVNSKMTAIADEIRAKTGGTEPLSLDDMAENVPKVYESGQNDVKEQVEPINTELEKCLSGNPVDGKSWYDEFWDLYLSRCEQVGYQYAFAGRGWHYDTFFPTRDIILKNGASYVFQETYMLPLKQCLDKNGVKLDTSNMTNMDRLFYWAMQGSNSGHIIPPIGNNNVTSAQYCFYVATGLEKIEKLTVAPTCNMTEAFFRCDALREITLENEIASSTWKFNNTHMLSRETITHIIGKLSEATTGLSITLSSAAVTNAFESVYSEEWQALVSSKPNWTISLV